MFYRGKNLSLEKMKRLTKNHPIHITLKVRIQDLFWKRLSRPGGARPDHRNNRLHVLDIVPGPSSMLNAADALGYGIPTPLDDRRYR